MQAKSLLHSHKHRDKPLQTAARAQGPEAMLEKLTEQLVQLMAQMKPALYERRAMRAVQQALDARDENIRHLLDVQEQLQREMSRMNERLSENQQMLAALLRGQEDTARHAAKARSFAANSIARQDRVVSGAGLKAVAAEGWEDLVKQGEARRVSWVKDGLVVPTNMLSDKWGRTRQALDQACDRGELISLKVGKNKFYPQVFLDLDADAVKRICSALKGDDSTAKFMFWTRRHGALGNKTIAEALKEGRGARAEELALGWSEERGLLDASAA